MSPDRNLNNIDAILFVCMGNICRSPTAEGVFAHKMNEQGKKYQLDSAGTIGSHAREKPDHRAIKFALARGYSLDKLRARKVIAADFERFDLILAMDEQNVASLKKIAPDHLHYKIELFLDYANNFDDSEVPDPYYGGAKGFQYVLDLVEDASNGLLAKLST